jgi:tRNA(Ile)-lysidine synthase
MASVADSVRQALASSAVHDAAVCLALSGGVDSVVLLDVLHALASERKLRLSALHVHHGLSAAADEWERFCAQLCAQRRVPFSAVHVCVARDSGLGLEAAARAARYEAYARADADYIALGHHLDDQAETFLLQLLRGAGPRGLSAMPVIGKAKDEGARMKGEGVGRARILRPLLSVTRAEIEAHARAHGLPWVEDESNRNTDLDRNFLRHELLPVLAARFPAYRETMARAARNLADANTMNDALAQIDWQAAQRDGELSVDRLRSLSAGRALNVLRFLFACAHVAMPPRVRLEEALRQCFDAAADAQVCVRFGDWTLRRYRDALVLVPWQPGETEWSARWQGEGALALPAGLGSLRFATTVGEGIAAARVRDAPVVVRFRRGGERFEPPGRPRRQLKKLLQESGVPPWERSVLPLLFCGDALVWVPGLGVAAPYRAAAGEAGVEIMWEAQPPADC